ncbi:MAG: hypothetical protein A2Y10_03415 [Planctomycetes bacterium GWF2_41_51]|nr:MAG: hypothetical protein A2Y10_03415 [Planctomycetes bacterium GWF2_41_51]HBG28971.1 hypothetical protein [Phycisphaerales bacterium]
MQRFLQIFILLLVIVCAKNLFADRIVEYLLEEGSATTVGDTAGNANNALFMGQPKWQTGHGGNSQYSLDFDGNTYFEAPDSVSLDSITSGFTMIAWIKADQSSLRDTIVWKLGAFRIWKSNANLMVTLDGVPNITDYVIMTGLIPNGVWLHIAVTYDGQYLAGYVDGVRKRRVRLNSSSIPISTSNYPLRVGWSGSVPHYCGSLDNVRLFNHALSDTEILADMIDDTVPTQPLTIVQSGTASTAIVIPSGIPKQTETVAANELQYHIEQATGILLGIYQENTKPSNFDGLIYIGACNATAAAGINGSYLEDNAYVIRNVGNNLFLAGHDSVGNPLGMLHVNDTRIGTMLAVYRFLEQYMGVKWLWPGSKGEIIPPTSNIVADSIAIIDKPILKHTRLGDYNPWNWGFSAGGWSSNEVRANYMDAQSLWLRRQGFCRSINLEYGEAFGTWWDTYHSTHPEYFNLLPDGTRRSDPYYHNGRTDLVSMNLSNPNFHHQIVDNWIAAGASGFIACAQNDTATKCTCPDCMVWDAQDPDLTIPWAERLTYATNAFNAGESDWYMHLGSMSTRLAKYLLAVQQEAAGRGYPDVTLHAWAYTNYAKGPLGGIQLNDRVVIGIVPGLMFPWTDSKRKEFRDAWNGWADTGAKLYLRPNYFLDGHNYPINFARKLGADFLYALRRGMFATHFDSLTGQWSTQALNLYMLARVQTHIDAQWENWGADVNGDNSIDLSDLAVLSNWWLNDASGCEIKNKCGDLNGDSKIDMVDFARLAQKWHNDNSEIETILDEFYESFGSAELAVRAYFDYWQTVSDNTTVSPAYGSWFIGANAIFTPQVMASGRALITNAQTAAVGNPMAERLVDFLEKGFTNAEKTLIAQKAWETLQNTPYGAGYEAAQTAWQTAYTDLLSYRASVEADFICNMGWLNYCEESVWN